MTGVLEKAINSLMEAHTESAETEVAYSVIKEDAEVANLARLYRIADRDFEKVADEHIMPINSVATADRAVDTYSSDYLLNLRFSYRAISNLCKRLILTVNKYDVVAPQHWLDFSVGKFPYYKELEDNGELNT